MKAALLISLLLASFYIGLSKVVVAELESLKNFYQNTDSIAQNIADNKPYQSQLFTSTYSPLDK